MALPKKAPPKPLDPAELLRLSPPLSLTVNKIYYGNKALRVDLSSARNDPAFGPGEGYLHEDAKELHRLLELKSGGGTYHVTAVDASGASLTWQVWLNERDIPDKVPAANQPAQDSAQQATASGAEPPEVWMARQTPGVPRGNLASVPPPASTAPSATTVDLQRREEDARQRAAEARTAEERIRAAEEQLRIVREQALQREYQARIEKQEAEHRRELDELRRERAAAPADNGVREMLASMVARMDKADEAHRREMEEMRREQADQARRREIDDLRATIATMNAKPSGIDSTVAMIIESNKQNIEMFKEQVRGLTEQQRERDRTALSAKDVIEITREAQKSSGGVEMVKTMTEITGAVVAMAKNAMDLNPGSQPHPVAEVIGNVFEKASTGFKEWVGAQRDVAVGQQRVMEAQAHAAGRMAPQGAPPQRPPVPPPAAPAAKTAADIDLERLGPAIEAVARLRKSVAAGALSPDQCIEWLRVALAETEKLGWNVPALKLLEDGRLVEFMRQVLPDTEPAFRQALSEKLTKFYEEEIKEKDEE